TAQDAHEELAMRRIGAVAGVDVAAPAPERAQRSRAYAFQLVVLLEEEKSLQQRGGFARVEVVRACLQKLASRAEARVDRVELAVLLRRDLGGQVLQQYGVQQRHGLCCTVIALHELLARQA